MFRKFRFMPRLSKHEVPFFSSVLGLVFRVNARLWTYADVRISHRLPADCISAAIW